MHDTFLFENISKALTKISQNNNLKRITKLCVTVHVNSHINEENLYNHLINRNSELIGDWTKIKVKRDNINELTAIIDCVEGEKFE